MTIKQFIEKAIEGGHNFQIEEQFLLPIDTQLGHREIQLTSIFLDPKTWEAVGKSLGWDEGKLTDKTYEGGWMWQHQMHRMIDALCEDSSIEEFIKSL